MTKDRKAYNPTPVFNRKFVRGMMHMYANKNDISKEGKAVHKMYEDVKKHRRKAGVHMYLRGSRRKRFVNRALQRG